jgi:O-antigen/teichoic acid export membrane protein
LEIEFMRHSVSSVPVRPFSRLQKLLSGGVLRGNLLVLASATIVNAGNYVFNLLLGRWLGPAGFADLSLIVTIFLILSFFAAALQTPAAKFAASYIADGDRQRIADLRAFLQRVALVIGLLLAFAIVAGAPLWAGFFSTQSFWIFVIFGVFVPFYLLQGVDRGVLQGQTSFGWLALSYQSEMWSRLLLGALFVWIGWRVNGAVLAVGLSFVATWLAARAVASTLPPAIGSTPDMRSSLIAFAWPVLWAQIGQILINNSDILIVRRFFPADEAGLYAALALIGRIVFFATWSVVIVMFPIVAQRHRRGEPHRMPFYLSLVLVMLAGGMVVGGTYFYPEMVVTALFGKAYITAAPLLWLYSLATTLFSLANVVVQYNLALDRRAATYFSIAAGVGQVVLLWLFHNSLNQVVMVQVWLMAALLALLLFWNLSHTLRRKDTHG